MRLVVDTNVFISALITPQGRARDLIEAAVQGRVTFILSPLLIAEVLTRAARPRFRRWFTEQDAEQLMQALILLSEPAEDVDRTRRKSVTRDPKDEYLVALAQHTGATLLVTGDKDLLTLQTGTVKVRTVREALEALDFTHTWGETFAPAVDDTEGLHNIATEGHSSVLFCAAGFMTAVQDRDLTRLRYLVTPESLSMWLAQLENVRGIIESHPSITGRPEYLTQDVAYVKIVPDPGVSMFATQEVLLDQAQLLTVQYRPRLPDPEGRGGWRVHSVGSVHWPVEDMPAVEPEDQQT